jgi:hypothetical protein
MTKANAENRCRDSAGIQAHGPDGLPGLANQRASFDPNAVLYGCG